MKCDSYKEKDLKNKNFAVLSYDHEDGCYYIEGLHVEREKAHKRWEHLFKEEQRLMARPEGWYAIDYIVVSIDDPRVMRSMNYETEDEDE